MDVNTLLCNMANDFEITNDGRFMSSFHTNRPAPPRRAMPRSVRCAVQSISMCNRKKEERKKERIALVVSIGWLYALAIERYDNAST